MNTESKKRSAIFGYILISLQLITLLFLNLSLIDDQDFYLLIILHITLIFYFALTKFVNKSSGDNHYLAGLIFSLGSYILNELIPIFSELTLWYFICIIGLHLCLFSFIFTKQIPPKLLLIQSFLIGLFMSVLFYQILYLSPLVLVGSIGIIALGIGLYLFSPFWLLYIFYIQYKSIQIKSSYHKYAFITGLITPLIIVGTIMVSWNNKIEHNKHLFTKSNIYSTKNLPQWVEISQHWGNDWLSKKILESDLLYDSPLLLNSLNRTNTSYNEEVYHDPFVVIGLFFYGEINIPNDTKMNVLNANYNMRHKTHRKLWSGKDLTTDDIFTDIKLYPEFRFAYIEKTISIKNNKSQSSWSTNQQEALYTFTLPEGSTTSSLSLWINGIEEKSKLTTRKKAEKAYTQIVGVERRDPALLHWQEGNTITVTIFPCTPKQKRKFKVGFTIPLRKENNELILPIITFDGPDDKNAFETRKLEIKTLKPSYNNLDIKHYNRVKNNSYEYTGYSAIIDEISFPIVDISQSPFSFLNNSYHLELPKFVNERIEIKNLYLDINSNWTIEEIKQIKHLHSDKNIYVYSDGWINLSTGFSKQVQNKLLNKNYCLFPFHKMDLNKSSLIVCKPKVYTPNIKDLSKSEFGNELKSFINKTTSPIQVFVLNNQLSSYLKTLNQFGVIHTTFGNFDELNQLIETNLIQKVDVNNNSIYLKESQIVITKDSLQNTKSIAPDHLLRQYNYNKILKTIGSKYFEQDSYEFGPLIELANEAYIVSPISSLIVLETQKDYDKHNIKDNSNSLKNAKANKSGAVPEPHEWALIIISLLALIWFKFKK